MAKSCGICGKKLGFFTITCEIKPGKVCTDCYRAIADYRYKLGKSCLELQQEGYSWEDGKRELEESKLAIQGSQKVVKDFGATSSFGIVHFSDNTNSMLIEISNIQAEVFEYDQIISFDLIENGNNIISGGTGRALAGGILFGEVGAVVGGATATRKMTELCTLLKIKISFRNSKRHSFDITFIDNPTGLPKNSYDYTSQYELAEELMTALQVAVDKVKKPEVATTAQALSGADEILKYKNLMDAGIITEEEFQAKKKQLLGL